MSNTITYLVTGMTCGHCAAAVKDEVGGLDGVTDVDVDLVEGGESTVRVTSEVLLDADEVRGAVDEAGYTVVGTTA